MRALLVFSLVCLLGCPSKEADDAGFDAGRDAGPGLDAGTDAGSDAGYDAGPPPFDAGTLTMTELCDQYLDAFCSYYSRCGFTQQTSTCLSLIGNRLNPWFARTCLQDERSAIDAGRAAFDGWAAAACMHALRSTISCSGNAASYATECQSIVLGRAIGACAQDFECTTGNYCDGSFLVCPGQCRPRKAIGMAAGSDHECVTGAYVYQGVCRSYAFTGLSCAPVDGGPAQTCRPGEAFCESQTCIARRQLGYLCTVDDECAFPLRCGGGHCQMGAGPGETCGYGIFGAPSQICKIDLKCQNPLNADGGSCVPLAQVDGGCFSVFECAGSATCRGVEFAQLADAGFELDAGRCQPAGLSNDPCSPAVALDCELETQFCRTDAGAAHCTPRRSAGGGCFTGDECLPPDTCIGGVCRRPVCVVP